MKLIVGDAICDCFGDNFRQNIIKLLSLERVFVAGLTSALSWPDVMNLAKHYHYGLTTSGLLFLISY